MLQSGPQVKLRPIAEPRLLHDRIFLQHLLAVISYRIPYCNLSPQSSCNMARRSPDFLEPEPADVDMPFAWQQAEELDPHGNVLVASGDRLMRVSLKVLSLISRTFKDLVRLRRSRDGPEQPTKQNPLLLDFSGDNDAALRVLLHITHFTAMTRSFVPSHEVFCELTRVAHKYGATHVIEGQCDSWLIAFWLENLPAGTLQDLTAAAYRLKNDRQFARITRTLVQRCTDKELEDNIDQRVLCAQLRSLRGMLIMDMQRATEHALGKLRHDDPRETFLTPKIFCTDCKIQSNIGGDHSYQADYECRMCGLVVPRVLCNAGLRAKHMMQFLEEALHLWPVTGVADKKPHQLLAGGIIEEFKNWNGHECAGGKGCPLLDALRVLEEGLQAAYDRTAGIDRSWFEDEMSRTLIEEESRSFAF